MSKELWGSGCIYRRGRVWWFCYSVRGTKYRRSAHTQKRSEAVNLLKKYVGESAGGKVVIAPIAERVTLAEMLQALADNYKVKNRRKQTIVAASRYLLSHFGKKARAVDLTSDAISHYVAARRAMLINRATGKEIIVDGKAVAERILQPPSNGTINYELAILRRAFNLMVRAKKLSKDHPPAIEMLEEAKPRKGFLRPADFERLHDALPDYLRDPIRFLYLSGWRKMEMVTLEWSDVELERDEHDNIVSGMATLRPEQSKNHDGRELPLPGELLEIIERADVARKSLSCASVFQHDGAPLGSFRKTWTRACKAAGFGWLLVHDLRRSAVRNLVDSGLPDDVAMVITGHKTHSVFERYKIRDTKDKKDAMAKAVEWVSAQAKLRPKVVALRKTA